MTNRNPILTELKEISLMVANIPYSVPYQQLPDGYFNQLPEKMLQLVKADEGSVVLDNIGKETAFEVPPGYFENFAESVLQRLKANKAGTVDEELSALSPLLGGLKKTTPFQVPKGYFDDLSGNAMEGAKAIEFVNEELENLSPLMASLKDKQVFKVSDTYFDELPGKLLSVAKEQTGKTKVVSMSSTRRVMRLLVAAVITGIVVLAGILFLDKKPDIPVTRDIAGIEEIKKDVDQLSDNEIQSFIENINTAVVEVNNPVDEQLTENDVHDLLADISDDEILKYVDEHPGAAKKINY